MKAAALGVLSQNSASRAASHTDLTDPTEMVNGQLTEYYSSEQLSVIGSDDLGFAVVTADDHVRPVIGYSATPFAETMLDGFKWWLEKAKDALSRSMVNSQQSVLNSQHSAIMPLLTTKWGQEYP